MTFAQFYALLSQQGGSAAGFLLMLPLLATGLAALCRQPQQRRWLLDLDLWLVAVAMLAWCLMLGYNLAIAGWLGPLNQWDLRLLLAPTLALARHLF